MIEYFHHTLQTWFSDLWAQIAVCVVFLVVVAWLAKDIVERVLIRGMRGVFGKMSLQNWDQALLQSRFYHRLSQLVPLFIADLGIRILPGLSPGFSAGALRLVWLLMVFLILLTITSALNAFVIASQEKRWAKGQALKGYVQLLNLIIWCFGLIVLVAILINRSPLLLVSGLGAMSAVLLLIFKDTLLSFVASVQLTSNNMLKIGDWIEMPQAGADGFVIDMALHTVKVENWDKTITTIPTYKLFAESFKNWSPMFESGGRRIKRALLIDTQSVRFMTPEALQEASQQPMLQAFFETLKQGETSDQAKRVTNLALFRAYAKAYLLQHPGINTDMLLIVRSMEPRDRGVPVELYCFTRSVAWVDYEQVQGEVFDHLLAVVPELGLRLYQSPAGHDVQQLAARPADAA